MLILGQKTSDSLGKPMSKFPALVSAQEMLRIFCFVLILVICVNILSYSLWSRHVRIMKKKKHREKEKKTLFSSAQYEKLAFNPL